jgi:hypothetical protein
MRENPVNDSGVVDGSDQLHPAGTARTAQDGPSFPGGPPYRRAVATDERSGSESAITIPGRGDHDAPGSMIRMKRNERSGSAGPFYERMGNFQHTLF